MGGNFALGVAPQPVCHQKNSRTRGIEVTHAIFILLAATDAANLKDGKHHRGNAYQRKRFSTERKASGKNWVAW